MPNFAAIDIGGTKMLMYAEWNGEILEKRVLTGPTATPASITKDIHEYLDNLPFKPDHVGVAVPGYIDHGELVYASDVRNIEGITEDMFSTENYKCHFINDCKAATYYEASQYPKEVSVAVVMVGTGIGMGMRMNGTYIMGAKGWSGEPGFTPFFTGKGEDQIETCDNYLTGISMLTKMGCDAETFIKLIKEKDEKALKVLNDGGLYCGLTLAMIINMLNPEVIIFGGSTTTYPGYMEKALQVAEKHSVSYNWKCVRFEPPKDLKRMVIKGCLEFAKEQSEL
ncbi:hypothetical protein WA158_003105 [Blastocystis sp. Blastoise]